MVGALAGLGVYTFRYAEGLSYLSNDPRACTNCHVMQDNYETWIKSSHHAVASCNDCHTPHTFPQKYLSKLENGWNHSRKFTMQNFKEPIRIRKSNLIALQDNCMHCHENLVSNVSSHHEVAMGEARCTECHRSVGHAGVF